MSRRYHIRLVPSRFARIMSPSREHIESYTNHLIANGPLREFRLRFNARRYMRANNKFWKDLPATLTTLAVWDSKKEEYL